jgi:hypothetical protein
MLWTRNGTTTPQLPILALFEQLVPSNRLTIRPVLDLQPTLAIVPVHAVPSLGDDSFQIASANFFE